MKTKHRPKIYMSEEDIKKLEDEYYEIYPKRLSDFDIDLFIGWLKQEKYI